MGVKVPVDTLEKSSNGRGSWFKPEKTLKKKGKKKK